MNRVPPKRRVAAVLFALGLLGALVIAASASAEKPIVVRSGNLELSFNGGFTPKSLSKTKFTPISLNVSGKIKTLDGTHPPALKQFILETDKNGAVNVAGYPVCKPGKLQAQDTSHAEKACKSAIVGKGTTDVEILFEESKPVPVKSKLIVFNGGVRGGVTTFYIHAYITFPVPAAIVTTVKISKIHKGRFGTLAIASIPKIAGGSGSVTSFSLNVSKKFTYRGKKVSVLSAKCPDGQLQARGEALFSDGSKVKAGVTRTCTPKG
jgi:hypothetical protein